MDEKANYLASEFVRADKQNFFMHRRKQLGNYGEQLACEYLVKQGYQILYAPWTCLPFGEIDIVARDGKTLVFVEVKTRKTSDFGYPEEAVTRRKRVKISHLIDQYLQQHRLPGVFYRFDIIAVLWEEGEPEIRHLKSIGIVA